MSCKLLRKLCFLLVFSCVFTITGCRKAEKDTEIILTTPFEENEVFRIDDETCFLPEVMVYMENSGRQYEGLFGEEIWKKDLGGITLGEQLKDTILARLAQIKVMQLMARSYGLTTDENDEAMADKAAGEYFSSLDSGSVSSIGLTRDTVKEMYLEYAMANRLYDYITGNVNPEISDDEARTIKVKHILIKTYVTDADGERIEFSPEEKKKAKNRLKAVLEEIKEGADFDEMAGKYNEDDKITYSFMKGVMPEAFEEAAFDLDTDEVSDIVETEYGYHIIKCVSTFDRDETDRNKEKIVRERKNQAFNEEYSRFVSGVYSNLNEELWDSLSFDEIKKSEGKDFFEVYDECFSGGEDE